MRRCCRPRAEGRHEEAIESLQRALELDPDYPVALTNLGTSLQAGNRLREAAAAFERALELRPDMVTAQYNLGSLYLMLDRLDEAADCFARALELRPAAGGLYAYLGYARARLCDWREWHEIGARTVQHLQSPAAAFEEIVAPPFGLFGLAVPPELRLEAAKREALRISQAVAPLKAEVNFSYARRGRTLRLGYLSPDFRRHSLGRTFADILAAHDRDLFEIHGYSLSGAERHDEVTKGLARDFDSFVELRPLSDRQAAERINADRIDILVDPGRPHPRRPARHPGARTGSGPGPRLGLRQHHGGGFHPLSHKRRDLHRERCPAACQRDRGRAAGRLAAGRPAGLFREHEVAHLLRPAGPGPGFR